MGTRRVAAAAIILSAIVMQIAPRGSDGFMIASAALLFAALSLAVID